MYNDDISESIKWLKSREGFAPRSYSDYGQQSIGYGTGNTGLSNINEANASKLLENEVLTRRTQLGKDYPQGISKWAKLALDDRLYNAGVEGVRKSKFLGALKNLDEDEADRQLNDWNKVTEGGKKVVNQGLTNRINVLKARRGPANEDSFKEQPQEDKQNLTDLYDRYMSLQKPRYDVRDTFRMQGVEDGEDVPTGLDLFSLNRPELKTLDTPIDENRVPLAATAPIVPMVRQPEEQMVNQSDEQETNTPVVDNTTSDFKLKTAFDNYKAPPILNNETIQDENPLNKLLADYMTQKRLAEETANKNQLLAGLARAGSTLGAGIAGIKNPDQTVYSEMSNAARRLPAGVDSDLKAQLGVRKMVSDEAAHKDAMEAKREYTKGMLEQARIQAGERADTLKDKAESKKEDREIKDMEYLAKFGTAADNARSQTPLGNAGMTVRRSNVLKALAGRTGGKVTSTEVKELAAVTDALLRGGNTAVGTLKMLLPNDVNATTQKVVEWITSDPHAVDRKEFMNRLINIADSEQMVADATIKENLFSQLAPRFGNLEKLNNPEVALYLKDKGIYNELLDFAKGNQRQDKYIDTAMQSVKDSHNKSTPKTGAIERLDPKTGKIALFDQNKQFIGWK
jgi:GH24 family phage-related lysozyme (muramidase)